MDRLGAEACLRCLGTIMDPDQLKRWGAWQMTDDVGLQCLHIDFVRLAYAKVGGGHHCGSELEMLKSFSKAA